MPSIEQMLKRAAEYRRKAEMLEGAAHEMNGHAGALPEMKQAIATRKQQRPPLRKGRQPTAEEIAARIEALKAVITKRGPQTSRELKAYLAEQGQHVPSDLGYLLRKSKQFATKGHTTNARWHLKG